MMKKTLYFLRSYFAKIIVIYYNLATYYLLEYSFIGMSIFIIFSYIYYILVIMSLLSYEYFDFLIFLDNLINESIKIYEEPTIGKSCHCQGDDPNTTQLNKYKDFLDSIIQGHQNPNPTSFDNSQGIDEEDIISKPLINPNKNEVINDFTQNNDVVKYVWDTRIKTTVAESRRLLDTHITGITYDSARDSYTLETKYGVSHVKYNKNESFLVNLPSTWSYSDSQVNLILSHSNTASQLADNVSDSVEKLRSANAALYFSTGVEGYSYDKLNELSKAVDTIKKPDWIFGPVTTAESFKFNPNE